MNVFCESLSDSKTKIVITVCFDFEYREVIIFMIARFKKIAAQDKADTHNEYERNYECEFSFHVNSCFFMFFNS